MLRNSSDLFHNVVLLLLLFLARGATQPSELRATHFSFENKPTLRQKTLEVIPVFSDSSQFRAARDCLYFYRVQRADRAFAVVYCVYEEIHPLQIFRKKAIKSHREGATFRSTLRLFRKAF